MRAESGFVAPPDADDVALVDDARGRLHLAASAASLGEEVAYLAEVDSGGVARGAIPIGRAGTRTFRPALCRHEDGVLAVACAGDRLAGLWLRAGHEPVRWDHALTGSAWHVALAAGDEARGAWIAVELRRPGERRIAIGRIDPATGERASEVELGGGASWCRWPALVALPGPGCLAAWCQGDARGAARVLCSPVGGAVAPIAADPAGGPGEAPALALAPDGSAVVAWHVGGASLTDGLDRHASVRRAIRLSRWSPAAARSMRCCRRPTAPAAPTRAARIRAGSCPPSRSIPAERSGSPADPATAISSPASPAAAGAAGSPSATRDGVDAAAASRSSRGRAASRSRGARPTGSR